MSDVSVEILLLPETQFKRKMRDLPSLLLHSPLKPQRDSFIAKGVIKLLVHETATLSTRGVTLENALIRADGARKLLGIRPPDISMRGFIREKGRSSA
jgi:hypothetical protein